MLYVFDKNQRKKLKLPFGPTAFKFPKNLENKRIIAIGDIIVLSLLRKGIRPFIAVFDFKTRRKNLDKKRRTVLENAFDSFVKINNPPGYLSESIIKIAKDKMKAGGAIIIDGEEDLTLLAFLKFAKKDDIFVYGFPNKGFCIVEGKNAKKISNSFLSKSKKVVSAIGQINL